MEAALGRNGQKQRVKKGEVCAVGRQEDNEANSGWRQPQAPPQAPPQGPPKDSPNYSLIGQTKQKEGETCRF